MPTETADSRLTLIPVDPHRVFASWYLAPAVLEEIRRCGDGETKLTLRLVRMDRDGGGARETGIAGDFDAGEGWNDRFLSLGEPGGTIAGSLGVRDTQGGFTACLSSIPVVLPEAPARPLAEPAGPAAEPAGSRTEPASVPPIAPVLFPSDGPVGGAEAFSGSAADAGASPTEAPLGGLDDHLDERGIIQSIGGADGLPPELVRLPTPVVENGVLAGLPLSGTYPANYYPARIGASTGVGRLSASTGPGAGGVFPGIEALTGLGAAPDDGARLSLFAGNGSVGQAGGAANSDSSAGADSGTPLPPADGSRPVLDEERVMAAVSDQAPSSHRLASQVVAGRDPAPMRVSATLVIAGRLDPGLRLRIGNREIAPRSDGGFDLRWPIDSFPAVWSLLLDVLLRSEAGAADAPSIELMTRLPAAGALLALDSSIDIEGEVGDPAYAAHLPPGINPDGAGRFRVVRPLPAGLLLLPHLVLLAKGVDGAGPTG